MVEEFKQNHPKRLYILIIYAEFKRSSTPHIAETQLVELILYAGQATGCGLWAVGCCGFKSHWMRHIWMVYLAMTPASSRSLRQPCERCHLRHGADVAEPGIVGGRKKLEHVEHGHDFLQGVVRSDSFSPMWGNFHISSNKTHSSREESSKALLFSFESTVTLNVGCFMACLHCLYGHIQVRKRFVRSMLSGLSDIYIYIDTPHPAPGLLHGRIDCDQKVKEEMKQQLEERFCANLFDRNLHDPCM